MLGNANQLFLTRGFHVLFVHTYFYVQYTTENYKSFKDQSKKFFMC